MWFVSICVTRNPPQSGFRDICFQDRLTWYNQKSGNMMTWCQVNGAGNSNVWQPNSANQPRLDKPRPHTSAIPLTQYSHRALPSSLCSPLPLSSVSDTECSHLISTRNVEPRACDRLLTQHNPAVIWFHVVLPLFVACKYCTDISTTASEKRGKWLRTTGIPQVQWDAALSVLKHQRNSGFRSEGGMTAFCSACFFL